MGLLAAGTPLSWSEARNLSDHIRHEGIEQLLQIFKFTSRRRDDPLLWGDELEYMMLEIDCKNKNITLDVAHDSIITELNTNMHDFCHDNDLEYHPEYGRYMLEATPSKPYNGLKNFEYVEENMKRRRLIADRLISKFNDENKKYIILSLTNFPRLGSDNDFLNVKNYWNHKNSASRSLFLPDEVINRHVRFPTLTANIRTRRGEKVCINVPMFKDINTPEHDTSIYNRDWFLPEDEEAALASKPGYIYMDAMGFGMGASCLQTTYQAPNIDLARFLYDSLINFAPIMLSVSAASPIWKGWLADQDVRWNVISNAVDCRTPFERNSEPLLPKYNEGGFGGVLSKDRNNMQRIPKSRYSCVDLFLGGQSKFYNRSYNDTNVPINEKVLKRLLENDITTVDYDLAKHFAHIFIRDSVSIFEESIDQDRLTSTNHFENIQSTNWQTLRFKPPTQHAIPSKKNVPGWRVEFRPLEIQLTEFENAAFSIFIYLIVESVLTFNDKLNPYLYMSRVEENMEIAHRKDSILNDRFYWKDNFHEDNGNSSQYTMDEIFHNKENGIFEQFINPILRHKKIILQNWEELKQSPTHQRLYYYLKLISERVKGNIPTTANYIREYVVNHPEYKKDSRVTREINFDLILLTERITNFENKNEINKFFGTEIGEFLLH